MILVLSPACRNESEDIVETDEFIDHSLIFETMNEKKNLNLSTIGVDHNSASSHSGTDTYLVLGQHFEVI